MQHNPQNDDWDLVIKGHTTLFDLRLKEVWNYRDLLFLFVKRENKCLSMIFFQSKGEK